ncbi:BgTH12-02267 [Blumeria graminis f. sp. triticale]|uniref:BgTH12-02267 n=1 Tax=Blumeria graminis f. sp. triticale TaxID=1689686 RepID=A0A9W4D0R0_BLUGR|nr:BgTH12-02267 [Blumeria graminis f. sp. triticale]
MNYLMKKPLQFWHLVISNVCKQRFVSYRAKILLDKGSKLDTCDDTKVSSAKVVQPYQQLHKKQKQQRDQSYLLELAHVIVTETKSLDRQLGKMGAPMPGFDVESPQNFPIQSVEVENSRAKIIQATEDLGSLVKGPAERMRCMAWDHNNSLSLHAIYHYKIAQSFPANETRTFSQIAAKVGLGELNVRRLLRHAMTNRIFTEVKPTVVAHTAASKLLAENPTMNEWVGFCVEEMWQAAACTVAALQRNPEADDPKQTGFCLSNATSDAESMFDTFAKSPFRSARMGRAMKSLTDGPGHELTHLLLSYGWADLDRRRGTVVDIGGSHGFASIALASAYPCLKFIVQDTATTIASAPALSAALTPRIRFQVHDFHTPQPIKGANVYFFRWILHNYSDRFAVHILRNLIPALKPGARILINEYCLPESNQQPLLPRNTHLSEVKNQRTMDLVMLTLLNSQERSESDFRELFKAADARFRFIGAYTAPGSRMALIEVIWDGEISESDSNP